MTQPSGISRRLQQTVERLQARDYEGALVNLFPAIDRTAKKRRPKEGVGPRIRAFLEDEEALISAIATGNILTRISLNSVSITDALTSSAAHQLLMKENLIHDFSSMTPILWRLALSVGTYHWAT